MRFILMVAYSVLASTLIAPEARATAQTTARPSSPAATPQIDVPALPGKYIRNNGDRLEINADGTSRFTRGSKTYDGTYKFDGETVTMRINHMRKEAVYRFSGKALIGLEFGDVWAKETVAAQTVKSSATDVPRGSSMAELETWFDREVSGMAAGEVVTKRAEITSRDTYKIEKAVLSNCHLSLHSSWEHRVLIGGEWEGGLGSRSVQIADLFDVDLGKLDIGEYDVPEGETRSKPSFYVSLAAATDRGDAFLLESERLAGGSTTKKSLRAKTFPIRVGDQQMASDLAGRIRRAAALCGAVGQPLAPVSAETALSVRPQALPPKTSEKPRMTNADVVRMVKAGLSDTVVVTSIRQSGSGNFDLNPTALIALKEARVSDAVISAMQENPTSAPTAPLVDKKTPTKYDSSLATAAKTVTSQPARSACSGVELMGLYKNDIFDRAMGGGVVEWLAKIRNNTDVTKIVVFGWRDVYGQQQKGQIQIRGGEIASPRVDMSQARAIPPVANLQLLSCE